jgi:hypothetical protein
LGHDRADRSAIWLLDFEGLKARATTPGDVGDGLSGRHRGIEPEELATIDIGTLGWSAIHGHDIGKVQRLREGREDPRRCSIFGVGCELGWVSAVIPVLDVILNVDFQKDRRGHLRPAHNAQNGQAPG